MRIVATFPGRFGDMLWSLPTVRAISEHYHQPIDLLISGKYGALAPLIRLQPYIRTCYVLTDWLVQETAPMTPAEPPALPFGPYDRVFHLGYRAWPDEPLPQYIWKGAQSLIPDLPPPDLDRPWLQPPPPHYGTHFEASVTVGFTDEHFELKFGIYILLTRHVVNLEGGWQSLCGTPGSRWQTEAWHGLTSWETAASRIAGSQLFLGCCSALHVLACGLGVPVVLMEPNPHRHHVSFYPYGTEGPRVTLVRGNDGLPTFDARHVLDAIRAGLARGRT